MPPFLVNKVPDGIQCQEHNTTYGSNMLQVTILASEWESSNGGLSAMNRELAIQLAKLCCVKVTLFMPTGKCSDEHKKAAHSHGISILEAVRRPGLMWLLVMECNLVTRLNLSANLTNASGFSLCTQTQRN